MSQHVLVVDDNTDDRKILVTVLQFFGYATLEAADAHAGLELARQYRPRLAVIDLAMPEVSGLDLGRSMRADPRLATMPMIAVTSHPQYRDEARVAGFDYFFEKPHGPQEFMKAVEQFLDREP